MNLNLATPSTPKLLSKHEKMMEEENTEEINVNVPTSSEHFMPHLMKYVLDNKLGVLPYQVQGDIRHYNIRKRVNEIDDRRIFLAQSNQRITSSVKK